MSSNSEGCCGLSDYDGPGVCNDSASVRSPAVRVLSVISAAEHHDRFRQIWTIPGASTRQHPAPYPRELATRLVRMFSFVGDTVLDPFLGIGTTSVAAVRAGRNSVGIEVDREYVELARSRFLDETNGLFGRGRLRVEG